MLAIHLITTTTTAINMKFFILLIVTIMVVLTLAEQRDTAYRWYSSSSIGYAPDSQPGSKWNMHS